jgi:glycosyltransferase involved in cell wall biosynthesis
VIKYAACWFIKKVKSQKVKTYVYKKNLGKGWALRFGMGKAKGDYVAFIDAGMEIDPNGLSMLLEHLEWYDADIIVGSKRHPASYVEYPLLRKVLSWVYYLLVRTLFGFRVHDTQAGIKIFKRKVLEAILPRLLIKRYALDVEILAVANYLGFRRIYEAPIRIRYGFGGSLTSSANLKTIMGMILDTAAIFYRLYIRRYYDGRNWRQWKKFNELYRT